MGNYAGWQTTAKVSGTAASMTAEACTGATTTWQITDTAKRVLDPSVTPTWYDNAVAISSGDISSVNYLTGTVVFTGSKTGPITVDADYYPMLSWASARMVEYTEEADELDTSVFGSQQKSSIQGMKAISGNGEILERLDYDLDSGGDTQDWQSRYNDGVSVVLEITPGSGTARFWAKLFTIGTQSATADLVTYSFGFASDVPTAADGTRVVPVNF